MAKSANGAANLGTLSNKIYELLSDLAQEDRAKVINSVLHLFGEATPAPPGQALSSSTGGAMPGQGAVQHAPTKSSPPQFFAQKGPHNKGEMLAVAARYLELNGANHPPKIEDFTKFFADARQGFDRSNFSRDIKNAANKAGLFVRGAAKGQYQLSYFGQQYVDALPDRDAVKKLKRPKRSGAKRRSRAKAGGSK